MKDKKTHSILLAFVGAYILYIVYMLMEKALSGANEMPFWAAIAFSCVFAACGVGVIIYAWRLWSQAKREENSQKDEMNDIK